MTESSSISTDLQKRERKIGAAADSRRAPRLLLAAACVAAAVTLAACAAASPPEQVAVADEGGAAAIRTARALPDRGAEILWDGYGIPHIYAATDSALLYAIGWAQAHSHGELLLRLFGQARGRASEYWGERFLDSDRYARTVGVPERGAAWYAAQPAEMRGFADAFVAGINDYVAAHPASVDAAARRVLPVTGADVLAHAQRVSHFHFLTRPELLDQAQQLLTPRGSNGWVIAPQRTAAGNAMLMANPHLPWGDLYTFYEMHIVSPGVKAYGAALVGMPLPVIAFNDSLGWTHTVNTIDGADVYTLQLDEDGYRFDGERRAFDVEDQVMLVRTAEGALESRPLQIARSVHGPVIARGETTAVALRVAGLDRAEVMTQYWHMLRARNLAEFERALRLQQMPMFTVLYADVHGRILHLFQGAVPRRPVGDWAFWARPVDGTTSALLWTEEHEYDDLPRVVDPPTGWLQNSNDPPWTTTVPLALDPADYPPYMAPRGMALRPQRSARLLAEEGRMTFDELVRRREDSGMELARRITGDVVAAARAHGGTLAGEAAGVLERWDGTADAGSRGGVLFQAFWREVARRAAPRSPFAVAWDASDPLNTPRGLADPALAAAALEAAAEAVRERHGALDVPWGDVYRLRLGEHDLPASGGTGALGEVRVLQFDASPDGRFHAVSGDTYVAVVEFSRPVRARTILTYGNASRADSPHRGDQLPLYAGKRLRPVWFTRAEVEANVVERMRLD